MPNLHLLLILAGLLFWGVIFVESIRRRILERPPYYNKTFSPTDLALAALTASVTAALLQPIRQLDFKKPMDLMIPSPELALLIMLGGVGVFTSIALWRRPWALLAYPAAVGLVHIVRTDSYRGLDITVALSSAFLIPAVAVALVNYRKPAQIDRKLH